MHSYMINSIYFLPVAHMPSKDDQRKICNNALSFTTINFKCVHRGCPGNPNVSILLISLLFSVLHIFLVTLEYVFKNEIVGFGSMHICKFIESCHNAFKNSCAMYHSETWQYSRYILMGKIVHCLIYFEF